MSKYLDILHSKKLFSLEDIVPLTNNISTAKDVLLLYSKKGWIQQIRRNLYGVNNIATKTLVADKYEIGSYVSASSYISYHSALEYHGISHQVFFNMFVSSNTSFRNFSFDDIDYAYCKSAINLGVYNPLMNSYVRVTDLERTIIDCIDRIDKAGGLEELVHCLSMVSYIDENKLKLYLDAYNKVALFKKTGFILNYFQNAMKLSQKFINFCREKSKASVSYLTDKVESDTYFKDWNLYAPENLLLFLEQGNSELI